MPDITQIIGVDEKYTIIGEVAPITNANVGAVLGASIGSTIGLSAKIVTRPIVKIGTPKTIIVDRYIREKVWKLPPPESLETPRDILDGVISRGRKLTPDYQVPFNPNLLKFGVKKLTSDRVMGVQRLEDLLGTKLAAKRTTKKTLGVQTATVFKSAEQITVDRRIQSQKKELRRDLKSEVMKNASMGNIIQAKDSQIKVANAEVSRLKNHVSSLNTRLSNKNKELKSLKSDIHLNYVTKLRYQKDITRLQMTLQKYAHMATGISAYQGEFKSGGDAGEVVKARRRAQVKAIEQIAETRRQGTLGNTFNRMGMKARRG